MFKAEKTRADLSLPWWLLQIETKLWAWGCICKQGLSREVVYDTEAGVKPVRVTLWRLEPLSDL